MFYNRHVHLTAATMSVLFALAAMLNHGIFEIRQGSTPTNGFFIEAISAADRFWLHGTEAAFTVVHNFLFTGILVVLVGLALIVFAVKYLSAPGSARILLLFIVLLTLFGGGIGHLFASLPTCGFATRIHAPLAWFERKIPVGMRRVLSRFWLAFLIAAAGSWLVVMELGIFGYFPGIDDPDVALNIVFLFLIGTTVFLSLAFVCAMAKDLELRR